LLAKEKEREMERRVEGEDVGGGRGCGNCFGWVTKQSGNADGRNERGKTAPNRYTRAKLPREESQQEEEQMKGGGRGGRERRAWSNLYKNKDKSVVRMIHKREQQMAAEKAEEEALVHEIEAQLKHTTMEEVEEAREAGMAARGKMRGYSPAPRPTSVPNSGGNTPSGYMLASIHQAGLGAVQAAAALQAIPLARKVGFSIIYLYFIRFILFYLFIHVYLM